MGTVSKNRGMSCVGVRKTGTTLIRVSTVMGTLYMTETDWELGNRRVPQYLLRLMAYKIQMEKLDDKRIEDDKADNIADK